MADESPIVRSLVCARLSADGHEVIEAGDGHEAIESARRVRPDVVVLDRKLPKLDGFEVCTRLRRESGLRSIGILMLTDHRGEHTRVESIERGADVFMSKPFSPRELSLRVSLLGSQRQLAATG